MHDEKLDRIFIRKNLSKRRKEAYDLVFKEIKELIGLTPSELLEEAKEDEQPYLNKKNQIIFKTIEDRKITSYFYKYYSYLLNQKYKEHTIKNKLGILKAFYNEYQIQLPKDIQINAPKKIIREGDIPTIKHIRKAVNSTNSTKIKALITLTASSGIRAGDIRRFQIKDLLESTTYYTKSKNLDDLLKLNPKNIIPCWDFLPHKTLNHGNICVTFNTPETTSFLFDYLNERIRGGEEITEESYLFTTKKKQMYSRRGFAWLYKTVGKQFGIANDEYAFFRSHTLRKFFISTGKHYTGDINKIRLLSGHASPKSEVDNTYSEININIMRNFYTALIPYLSIHETKIHDIKTKEFLKIEKELKNKEQKNKALEERLSRIESFLDNIK